VRLGAMAVPLGHGEGFVPRELLHRGEINPRLNDVYDRCMPHGVGQDLVGIKARGTALGADCAARGDAANATRNSPTQTCEDRGTQMA